MGFFDSLFGKTKKQPTSVSDKTLHGEVMQSDIPVILDIWGSNCPACDQLAPVMMQLAGKYDGKVKVCKVKVDENQELSTTYQIRSIPALLAFKEGKLVVLKMRDIINGVSCLVAYVNTGNTSPSLECYASLQSAKGGMVQNSHLREGDLIARKIVDESNNKECLITYVSTEGTSPHIHCSDLSGATAAAAPPPPARPPMR